MQDRKFTMNSSQSWQESIVNSFGYSMWVTSDCIILILIPSILGLLSEAVCFFVFMCIKVNTPLYSYLKAYTINNFLICCCLFIQFFYAVYSLGDPRTMTVINSYVIFPFLGLFYLNGSLLDVAILLDRISIFNKKVKEGLDVVKPFIRIILIGFVSVLFNIPYYFLYAPVRVDVELDNNSEYAVWISGSSSLSSTQAGNALVLFILIVDYIAVMLVQIVLNICSVIYIKHHLKDKKAIIGATKSQAKSYQNLDMKNGVMVTILCLISLVEHILFISCNVGQFFFADRINNVLLQRITFFCLGLRRFTDFFFYMKFNQVFKKQLLVSVGLTKDNRVHTTTVLLNTNRAGS